MYSACVCALRSPWECAYAARAMMQNLKVVGEEPAKRPRENDKVRGSCVGIKILFVGVRESSGCAVRNKTSR